MKIKKLEIRNSYGYEGEFWVSLDSMQDLDLKLTTDEVRAIEQTLEPLLSSILKNRLLGIANKVGQPQHREITNIWKLGQ